MNEPKPAVLHLITSLKGGPGRLLCDLLSVDEFRSRYNHAVWGMYAGDPALSEKLENIGVPVADLAMSHFYDIRALRRLSRKIKDFGPSVLHTSLFRADLYGQYMGKSRGIPVRIASILNTDDIAMKEDSGRPQAALFVFLYRRIAKWSSAFVASSQGVADNLAAKKIKPARTAVFPNAINIGLFAKDAAQPRDEYRARLGFEPDQIVIGSASVFNKRKGLPYLIEAFAGLVDAHPDAHLLLPGDGPMRADLEKMVRERPAIRHAVVFPGRVANMTDFLNAIDIYAQPALSEGLPLAVLQAMAAGKPILATRVGGIPEAIRDGVEGLLVGPRDSKALAEGLARLVRDPDIRHRLGANAKSRAVRDFDSGRLARDTLSLYDQLLKKPNRITP